MKKNYFFFLLLYSLIALANQLFAAGLLDFAWSGAVTHDSAVVAAGIKNHRTTNGTIAVEIKAFDNPNLNGAPASSWSGYAVSANYYIVKAELSNLIPDTKYYYGIYVNNVLDNELNDADNGTNSYTGTFKTFPPANQPASFMFTFSCSGKPDTEKNAIWDTIKDQDSLFFLHSGDLYYSDQGTAKGYTNENNFCDKYDIKLNCYPGKDGAREASFHRNVPLVYMWDDHDFGPNNSVGTSGKGAISKNYVHPVFRKYVPHYPLIGSGTTGIYQKFTVGRVLFLLTDLRTDAQTPGSTYARTRMGADQKKWFKKQLLKANGVYPAIVWVTTVPWTGAPVTGKDRWQSYTNERAEIATFIKENNIRGFCALGGDTHCTAIDDGTNTDFAKNGGAAFPIFHAGPLGAHNSVKAGPYSKGSTKTSDRNFGLVAITDNNECVEITWTGKNLDGSIATNENSGTGYPAIGSKIQYSFVYSNPVVTAFFPPDDSEEVPCDVPLTLTFNKNILTNFGNIVIRELSNDTVHASIPVNSTAVEFSTNYVIISLPSNLTAATQYYITIDQTAFWDANSNSFSGITAPSDMDYYKWDFQTATPEPTTTIIPILTFFCMRIK